MTSVQQKAGALADRIIAAGEASSKKLGVVGGSVAFVSSFGTVPVGAIGGGLVGGVTRGAKGVVDAYRLTPAQSKFEMDGSKTLVAAGVLGVTTTVVAGGAALLGVGELTLVGAGALGVFAAGAGFVGSGVLNGLAQGLVGAGKGGLKGIDAGIGAAKVVGEGAQYVTDHTAEFVVKVAKDVGHVVGVSAQRTVEAGREAIEDVRFVEVKVAKVGVEVAQATLDLAIKRTNRISNGGDRVDAKGNEIQDKPAEYQKF